ncbi:MAG: hypothetical protein J7K00_04160 [Candidatus Diapherotrites archaeon]|nr:hypothetical protein [Candidatus Diapherotrites archaeon]
MTKEEFGIEMIKFYKEFLIGSSKSVELLANIEKKFPKEYEVIKELKDDPKVLVSLSSEVPDNVKTVLFSVLVEASLLGSRMNKLFDLTNEEKETLATDIDKFAKKIEKELGGLIESKNQ